MVGVLGVNGHSKTGFFTDWTMFAHNTASEFHQDVQSILFRVNEPPFSLVFHPLSFSFCFGGETLLPIVLQHIEFSKSRKSAKVVIYFIRKLFRRNEFSTKTRVAWSRSRRDLQFAYRI